VQILQRLPLASLAIMLFLPSLLLAVDPADVSGMGTPVTRATAQGNVIGRKDAAGVERFFGVPTAADAGGVARFKAPQAISSRPAALKTLTEKMCVHMARENDGSFSFAGQEDCISVDILTTTGGSNLPVHVFVHGGGFMTQDGSTSRYTDAYYQTGTAGDSRTAVSVHVHYRMGALGFLAHPGLTAETGYSGSGNWGLLDVVASLQWIQANIANFGGDPSKVTVTGSSSGASMVMMLTASPLAAGLFKTAVAQSPYMGGNLKAGSYGITARYGMASMLISAHGCSSGPTSSAILVPSGSGPSAVDAANEVACMRGKSAIELASLSAMLAESAFDDVYGAGSAALIAYNSIQCWPVVDGYFLTKPPLESWTSGVGAGVNIVVGMNQDEYSTFYGNPLEDYSTGRYKGAASYATVDLAFVLAMDSVSLTASTQDWLTAVRTASTDGALVPKIAPFYADLTDKYVKAVQQPTDAWFGSALRLIVSTLVGQTGRTTGTVFRYLFAQDPSSTVTTMWGGAFKHMGACHGCELTYVTGWYAVGNSYLSYNENLPHAFSAAETTMGQTMKKFWLNIMHTGSPGSAGLATWTASTASELHTMVFKASLTNGATLDPCLDTTTCRVEASNDPRAAVSLFWQDPQGIRTWAVPWNSATQCTVGATGPTQSAMNYECGMPVLSIACIAAACGVLLLIVCWIAILAWQGRSFGNRARTKTVAHTPADL
jgi:carboxylesterase type B